MYVCEYVDTEKSILCVGMGKDETRTAQQELLSYFYVGGFRVEACMYLSVSYMQSISRREDATV